MDFVEMLSTIWRTKWIIIITALAAVALVVYNTVTTDPVYRADSTLVVGSMSPGTSALGRIGGEDKLAMSYSELITAKPVLDRAREIGELDVSNSVLASHLGVVDPPKDTPSPYVKLFANASNPQEAIEEVNAVSRSLVEYVSVMGTKVIKDNQDTILAQLTGVEKESNDLKAAPVKDQSRIAALDKIRESLISEYTAVLNANLPGANLRIVDEADAASSSASHPVRNGGLAFFVGALAGIAIGFAADSIRKNWRQKVSKAEAQH